MRDCIIVTADDVWIKVGEAFVHLEHVQQNRADICSCSRPVGVCAVCNRSLGDILAGADVILTGVKCEQCGQQYGYVDAPRACIASPEARGNPGSSPKGRPGR